VAQIVIIINNFAGYVVKESHLRRDRRAENGIPKIMRSTQVHELDDSRGRDSCHSSVRYPMEIENPVKFDVAAMTGMRRTGVTKASSGVEKRTY